MAGFSSSTSAIDSTSDFLCSVCSGNAGESCLDDFLSSSTTVPQLSIGFSVFTGGGEHSAWSLLLLCDTAVSVDLKSDGVDLSVDSTDIGSPDFVEMSDS